MNLRNFLLVVVLPFIFSCKMSNGNDITTSQSQTTTALPKASTWGEKVSDAAISIINPNVRYIPDYIVLDYPNGDVPANTGVCTDVVIRTYRELGIDLQKLVHEDMKANFKKYPQTWGLPKPDKNIDHRRVPNLMTFFSRKGQSLTKEKIASEYLPGDVVAWRLNSGLTHIGIVVDKLNRSKTNYQVVHNIGRGQIMEDCLFDFEIIGHYRYGNN